jgi:hypothetical protein
VKIIGLLKIKCVQSSVNKNQAQRKIKDIVFVDEVETQSREKPLRGSQTREFYYSEDEARYKIVTLTCTDAVVIPCSLTCNPTRAPPNQVSYLKGSSMESFTLGRIPKIDFTADQITHWQS